MKPGMAGSNAAGKPAAVKNQERAHCRTAKNSSVKEVFCFPLATIISSSDFVAKHRFTPFT